MLSGEYLVLKGAMSLALATSLGQHLSVIETDSEKIKWTSIDQNNDIWFDAEFSFPRFEIIKTTDKKRASFLVSLMLQIEKLNPKFILSYQGLSIETKLDFDPDWGLGSSSTLINNLASWACISPFDLLENTLGGSGYDIAVAETGAHILYNRIPQINYHTILFDPPFKDNIFFVYLNRKQDSSIEVTRFIKGNNDLKDEVNSISKISEDILKVSTLTEFESLLNKHNQIMSIVLGRESAQEKFHDYKEGIVKYLGAWGGDFMLVTGVDSDMEYFIEKGYETILAYQRIIK